jgi:hypothetical protein
MRVRLIGVAVVASALAGGGVSEAQIPAQDSVTGTAAIGFGRDLVRFTFDVHSGPSGDNPAGAVQFEGPLIVGGTFQISCLNVSGNRASMNIPAPPASGPIVGLVISVEDNGSTGDRIEWQPVLGTLPSGCPPPSGVFGSATTSGDVTVTDAPALATSKDQCKNGGWRDFPGFKNQGDCVSFVATTGKNPPASSP